MIPFFFVELSSFASGRGYPYESTGCKQLCAGWDKAERESQAERVKRLEHEGSSQRLPLT